MMRALALLLTVLTGFSGLVYEVTWQKALAILLGSHSEATAAVLAIFLGGLSLGYSFFGRVSNCVTRRAGLERASQRLLLVYGLVEASIGAWAVAWPHLFQAARFLSAAWHLPGQAASFSLDLLLTAVLIGPPAILMGGTIPLLTQALARDLAHATRFHAAVYGFNTLGAFAGALAGGFFLIPWLGIPHVLLGMGALNLAVGATFALISFAARDRVQPSPAEEPRALPAGFPAFAGAALLLGFAMMAIQTVLIRLGALSLGASHFTFAMVVATYVLCIAIGALAVSTLTRIPSWVVAACPLALGILLALLYPVLEYTPYGAHALRTLFQSSPQAFYPYYISVSLCVIAVLALPLGLSGASIPLIFHALRNEIGELGGLAGRIYGWNTFGSVLGALLGGYVLLMWLDLHHVYRIAVGSILVAGVLLATRLRVSRLATAAVGLVAVGALAWLPPWNPRQLTAGFYRFREVMPATWDGPSAMLAMRERMLGSQIGPVGLPFYDDDPFTTVSVIDYHPGNGPQRTRAIATQGKSDGSLLSDYPTMALAALVPCTLSERCETGFVVGLGTGVTAGELAALDGMRRVVVAEISPAVVAASPLFDAGNLAASKNPKIEIVRSDAYRALLHSDDRFDVIVSEPSNPWVAGVEMLYSEEFLSAARDRLAPGGVYAQWMHTYEVDDPTLALVLRTYASVFESVSVWYTMTWDLLLIGSNDGAAPDLDGIARRFERPDLRAGFRRAGVQTLEELLAHELIPVGYLTRSAMPGDVHTVLQPRLAQGAARAFFTGVNASLPYLAEPKGGRAALPLLTQLRARNGPESDDARARVILHVCQQRPEECAVLLARWQHDDPDSPRLRALLAEERARRPGSEHLDPRRIEALASLFGRGPERLAPEDVEALTELYFRYFYRPVPFDVDALRSAWRTCLSSRCAEVRQRAEQRLERGDARG